MEEIIMGSSSSSSSSSTEDEDHMLNFFLTELLQHHQKNENYSENVVPSYTDKEFQDLFKVPRIILMSLAEEFEQSEFFPKTDSGFLRIPPEKSMLIFCWFATHEAASFRNVADRFNISISTLHLIIENVSNFISEKSKGVIVWPSDEEKVEISQDFSDIGFPDVDGSHIRIDTPKNDHESYYNRKKYYSIQMQAACDSKRRIRDVFIGFPGSVHDARVFRNSPLFHTLQEKCGDKFILGDSAYPCLRNLLTPYKNNGHLTPVEIYYNKQLSKCRVAIEHTFGILKQKFRQLYHLKLRSIPTICHFIRACCVLHNLSLSYEEQDVKNVNDNEAFDLDNQVDEENEGNVGLNFRNYIASNIFINQH